MKVSISYLIFVLTVFSGGCFDSSGIAPPGDQLIYPVGVVTTASDDYLLALNTNQDLMYNAGTLVAISLDKMDVIIEEGGKKEWLEGKYMYVPEAELIEEKDTIRLGAFASDLELTPNQDRALIPIRGSAERHILVVDVDETAKSGRVLNCGQGSDLTCDSAHRVTSNESVTLPIEPYEVTSADYFWENQEVKLHNTLGFVTHPDSGAVSAFLIENDQGKLDARLLDVVTNVVPGASGIAANPVNGEIYVSGRENGEQYMAVLHVLAGGLGGTYSNTPFFDFGMVDKVKYGEDLLGGTDTRGIAVTENGKTAVMVSRTPEALLRIDTESRKLVDMATLGTDPSVVGIYQDKGEDPVDESDDSVYAFVVCYKSNQVFIVEPFMMQVQVRTTGSGPQAIAFDQKRKLAYISNFLESTITVIQAVPPFDHVRIGADDAKLMIGKPRLPQNN